MISVAVSGISVPRIADNVAEFVHDPRETTSGLARANRMVRENEEKRDTLNRFMDEEPDYNGEVEVVHYLSLLRDRVGWEKLREAVTRPLDGLRVAPFYGCTLVRPEEVATPFGSLRDSM